MVSLVNGDAFTCKALAENAKSLCSFKDVQNKY